MKTALGCGIDVWISTCCVRPEQGSAGQLPLEATGMPGPKTSRWRGDDPFARYPLSCCRRRGTARDQLFTPATAARRAGAVKDEVQNRVRL